MNEKQIDNAVIYIRVSTVDQAEDALNLANQEERCQNYCQRNGMTVAKVFIDPGQSARSSKRPEFQKMLSYCRVRRNDVQYVVVQDLSRFARNHLDQAEAIHDLEDSGALLRSTYEPNIDETAAGKLAANLFGAYNQYFSDSHSEKQRDRNRQAVAAGRVPWHAPIGYLNISAKQGPNIKPDEEHAPLIRRAFELMSTGLHKKSEALKIISKEGLVTLKGKPVPAQTFDKLLRNPLYAGWVTLACDPTFKPARGLHEPLVTQETFDRVQAVLDGRKLPESPRLKSNPEFPLRRLVRCEKCGTPLTGASCKGRGGHYPRYWCRTKGCRAVSAPKVHLESEFQAFLGQLRVDRDKVADFPKIARRAWDLKQGNSERELKQLTSQLEEKKRLKGSLLTLRMDGEISKEEFEETNSSFRDEICKIEESLRSLASTGATANSFVRFAELQLTDLAHIWRIANPEQRERVQNLLFEGGLDYSPKSGFLNRSKSSLFNVLETVDLQNTTMVGLRGTELLSSVPSITDSGA
jgi:DNA invertase Pin-like site-specific DNA recombinase